ncbi:adenylyltransferase/cytidyltransferase family protein [Ignatzschineria cameli]|uniref:Cytidyltransferase-like domain-containing protein n=1 Tax=Ignatzschineria cameli TaxID=2182793 RepID=A0A2U2AS25_9GAMM|nr:adenylyltransferase/cytidyltransferase family protein [Ignatzschineria cameli]PWD86658.1 hypothetical protein DC080_03250 [Ignatzschineria cameli]PWD86989.1 hypothetical protein DC077_04010 [Ignatzschineria cameli]PWD91962.1 hypothetical protein DC079_00945 [Ignatzschineria cameli]PWD93452.1 hypothetical protein DC081_01240 [Ignatzschineria cameli]PWD94194.1 hypothetical protein DC078_01240 [Ignatzschineria cameli]
MKKIGLIVGKFYPLHQGHISMILTAKLSVDQLHIFVCSETDRDEELYQSSAFTTQPTIEDRLHWAKICLNEIPGIFLYDFNEDGIPSYPNGWEAWSDRLKSTLSTLKITPTLIFSSEPQDKVHYEKLFQLPVQLIDPPRDLFPISATEIRENPIENWHFIPTIIRPFFRQRILLENDHPLTLPITTLFEMVEPTGNNQATSKVEFIVATPKEIPKILAQAQKRRESISLAIGSESFITEITQRALDYFQVPIPSYHLTTASLEAQFRDICHFINHFINSSRTQNSAPKPK